VTLQTLRHAFNCRGGMRPQGGKSKSKSQAVPNRECPPFAESAKDRPPDVERWTEGWPILSRSLRKGGIPCCRRYWLEHVVRPSPARVSKSKSPEVRSPNSHPCKTRKGGPPAGAASVSMVSARTRKDGPATIRIATEERYARTCVGAASDREQAGATREAEREDQEIRLPCGTCGDDVSRDGTSAAGPHSRSRAVRRT